MAIQGVGWLMFIAALGCAAGPEALGGQAPLDPRGAIHVPIGVANTLDTLKTFVEAEGVFSPGFATYGVYFWLYDSDARKLSAPTLPGTACERGLNGVGHLIPWSAWQAGAVKVRSEVCEVRRESPAGSVFVAAARVTLTNTGPARAAVTLYAALRPLGPAGGPVKQLAVSDDGCALLVDGHPALVAETPPTRAGVLGTDAVAAEALAGRLPAARAVQSAAGDCSGALCCDVALAPGATTTLAFICPVLAGRRAVGHHWGPGGHNNYKELAEPNPAAGGVPQPDPGLAYYRQLRAEQLFAEAAAYYKDLTGHVALRLPDPRWAECFAAITGHVGLCLNEDAPDVAVINYATFNRDGVYNVNILQKAGQFPLAAAAGDYFLKHPFNGRPYPEADNPGQVLWITGEHWLFTRDRAWLERVYPAVRKLAALITYYRTTPPPHWVDMNGLECGAALPPERRSEFKLGSCDGRHPEYTEAYDLAGLRAAVTLAHAQGQAADAAAWERLAEQLGTQYDQTFGARLPQGYGSYAVLWPCRLYPLASGKAHDQFQGLGAQAPGGWRYFPLARAHQGLLAGNRAAGHGTLESHLAHEQMRGWYVADEGGGSGPGGWGFARTTWKPGVAMPHGWAISELHLLLRDCLVFEDTQRLVLLAGIPEAWFTRAEGLAVTGLPTHFGTCSFTYTPEGDGAVLKLTGAAAPPEGFVLRLPPGLAKQASAAGPALPVAANGDVVLPAGTREVRVVFR